MRAESAKSKGAPGLPQNLNVSSARPNEDMSNPDMRTANMDSQLAQQ